MAEYDFIESQKINIPQLKDELTTAGLPLPSDIQINDVNVQVFYDSDLSAEQQDTLSQALINHVANPTYVTIAVQADINKLISYLNNADPTVASKARATMVLNLAPRLPDGLVVTINAQIAALVGF